MLLYGGFDESFRDNGKEAGNYSVIGIIQGFYRGYLGMMEKRMEATI